MVLGHALLTGHGFAACPETAMRYTFFDRFLAMTRRYPAVVGLAFLRPYHTVSTFKKTAAITCSTNPEHTGKGIGRSLLDLFLKKARNQNVANLLAGISSFNEESLNFVQNRVYIDCDRFKEVGKKLVRTIDIV